MNNAAADTRRPSFGVVFFELLLHGRRERREQEEMLIKNNQEDMDRSENSMISAHSDALAVGSRTRFPELGGGLPVAG